jgi:hypothetical protein
MKRARFSCLMAVCLGLSMVHPAHANIGGLADYIGGLSGPGPFDKRPAFFLDLPCWEGVRGNAQVNEALEKGESVPLTLLKKCNGTLRGPRRSLGFLISSWHRTDEIPTPPTYNYSPKQQLLIQEITDGKIRALPFGLTLKTTIPFVTNESWRRSVDIGATVGLVVFKSGKAANGETLFNTFAVSLVELPRVQVRPFAPIACWGQAHCPDEWTWWDIFELTVGARMIGGVTAEKFGAASGESSGLHVMKLLSAGISIKFR